MLTADFDLPETLTLFHGRASLDLEVLRARDIPALAEIESERGRRKLGANAIGRDFDLDAIDAIVAAHHSGHRHGPDCVLFTPDERCAIVCAHRLGIQRAGLIVRIDIRPIAIHALEIEHKGRARPLHILEDSSGRSWLGVPDEREFPARQYLPIDPVPAREIEYAIVHREVWGHGFRVSAWQAV